MAILAIPRLPAGTSLGASPSGPRQAALTKKDGRGVAEGQPFLACRAKMRVACGDQVRKRPLMRAYGGAGAGMEWRLPAQPRRRRSSPTDEERLRDCAGWQWRLNDR